jgi:DNA-binding MarR family transcriptional regulator
MKVEPTAQLSFLQRQVLRAIWRNGGACGVGDLYGDRPKTAAARASLSRAIRHLVDRGLVVRDRDQDGGQRTARVELTDAGRRWVQRVAEACDWRVPLPSERC